MNKLIKKLDNAICSRLLNAMDALVDYRICGRSLVKYVPSMDRDDAKGVGGTGSQSTHYAILKRIFSHVTITEKDTVLDVGCGKSRILAYFIQQGTPGRICGIEHNAEVARVAEAWAGRYEQLRVIAGDALRLDYEPYTVLCQARPFLPQTFLEFLGRLEGTLTHPITLVYWCDQQSGYLLKGRAGWEMQFREKLIRIHGMRIAPSPQGYSIWTYDPERRRNGAGGAASPSKDA